MELKLIVIGVLLALSASSADAQCLHGPDESVDQGARRSAAVEFITTVNDAQRRSQREHGRYVTLGEAVDPGTAPVGFVAFVTVDRWGYAVTAKDLFDPCGFALFSDQHGYTNLPIRRGRLAITDQRISRISRQCRAARCRGHIGSRPIAARILQRPALSVPRSAHGHEVGSGSGRIQSDPEHRSQRRRVHPPLDPADHEAIDCIFCDDRRQATRRRHDVIHPSRRARIQADVADGRLAERTQLAASVVQAIGRK